MNLKAIMGEINWFLLYQKGILYFSKVTQNIKPSK